MKTSKLLAGGLLAAISFQPTIAQVLWSDNFDTIASPDTVTASGTSSGYTVNMSGANNRAIFGYDYGAANLGIPSAPNSSGGSTLGVRFDVNMNSAAAAAASLAISPLATFAGDYRLQFDLWMNSVGPFPAGGTGSSEHFTTGVGYNGSTFQNAASASGVWFGGSGDGGFSGTSTTPDYMARIGTTFQTVASGVYAAGTTTGNPGSAVDNANAYYTTKFSGQAAPAQQQTDFASQTGTANNGSLLFNWHLVEVSRIGNTVTWSIDGFLIATVTDNAALATDNLFIGYWDAANSVAGSLVFGVIDNVQVTAVPEPTSFALVGLAGLALLARRRK